MRGLAALFLVALGMALVAVSASTADGMTTCRQHHSFDVCHYALVR